jgi:hypothetical protein
MSEEPPGANVTITRTGFVGQACASAPIGNDSNKMKANRSFIFQLPLYVV